MTVSVTVSTGSRRSYVRTFDTASGAWNAGEWLEPNTSKDYSVTSAAHLLIIEVEDEVGTQDFTGNTVEDPTGPPPPPPSVDEHG